MLCRLTLDPQVYRKDGIHFQTQKIENCYQTMQHWDAAFFPSFQTVMIKPLHNWRKVLGGDEIGRKNNCLLRLL